MTLNDTNIIKETKILVLCNFYGIFHIFDILLCNCLIPQIHSRFERTCSVPCERVAAFRVIDNGMISPLLTFSPTPAHYRYIIRHVVFR